MLNPHTFLASLDLSEAEIDVYLAMIGGALTARDIVQVTGRSRPTVYYGLGALDRRGLLSKTGLEGDRRFRVEPLSRLKTMVEAKQIEIESLHNEVDDFVAQFRKPQAGDHKPQVAFYEGVSAVRNVIMETIYAKGRQIDSLVPTENFFWQLGPDFVTQYVKKRQDIGVRTRNLWGTTIDPSQIKKYYNKSEIRMMPASLGDKFQTTVFMYRDNVLYISSLRSGYALLVRSKEHYQLTQALYEVVWEISKPLKLDKV